MHAHGPMKQNCRGTWATNPGLSKKTRSLEQGTDVPLDTPLDRLEELRQRVASGDDSAAELLRLAEAECANLVRVANNYCHKCRATTRHEVHGETYQCPRCHTVQVRATRTLASLFQP